MCLVFDESSLFKQDQNRCFGSIVVFFSPLSVGHYLSKGGKCHHASPYILVIARKREKGKK